MNVHIYRQNRLSGCRPLVYCYTYSVIRPVSLSSPVNRAQSHQQFSTSNAHNWGGSNSVLCMFEWTHRLPRSGTIIQYLWTDRTSSPLLCSAVRERYWSNSVCCMSGLCVFCCLSLHTAEQFRWFRLCGHWWHWWRFEHILHLFMSI